MTERVDLDELRADITWHRDVAKHGTYVVSIAKLLAVVAELTELRAAQAQSGEHTAWERGYAQGYSDREKTDHDRADVEKEPNPYPMEAQSGWILCSASLPNNPRSVLFATDECLIYWGSYDGRAWSGFNYEQHERVVQWFDPPRTLPAPPEAQ